MDIVVDNFFDIPMFENSRHHRDNPFKRELTEDFIFRIGATQFTIKAGFWWDGASIPRFFWRVVGTPFTGKYVIPTLIHDLFYVTHVFSQKETDQFLFDMNKFCEVGRAKNNAIYYGVKMGGRWAYNKTAEQIQGGIKHLVMESVPYNGPASAFA